MKHYFYSTQLNLIVIKRNLSPFCSPIYVDWNSLDREILTWYNLNPNNGFCRKQGKRMLLWYEVLQDKHHNSNYNFPISINEWNGHDEVINIFIILSRYYDMFNVCNALIILCTNLYLSLFYVTWSPFIRPLYSTAPVVLVIIWCHIFSTAQTEDLYRSSYKCEVVTLWWFSFDLTSLCVYNQR